MPVRRHGAEKNKSKTDKHKKEIELKKKLEEFNKLKREKKPALIDKDFSLDEEENP